MSGKTRDSQTRKEKPISGLSKINLSLQEFAPEERKERSCQSYSASHIAQSADRSFHRPAFSRPVYSFDSYKVQPVSVCLTDFVLIKLLKAIIFIFIKHSGRLRKQKKVLKVF